MMDYLLNSLFFDNCVGNFSFWSLAKVGCFNVARWWYNAHNFAREGQGPQGLDVVVTYTGSKSAGPLCHWSWAEAPHASEVSGRGESCVSLLNLLALNVVIGFFNSFRSEWFYCYNINVMLLLNLMCSDHSFLRSTCSLVMVVTSYSHTHPCLDKDFFSMPVCMNCI